MRSAFLGGLAVLAVALFHSNARAEQDQAIARDDDDQQSAHEKRDAHEPRESREEWLRDFDFRGPVRIGTGYNKIWHSPVTAMSFEDEFNLWKLGPDTRAHILFGMSGWSAGDLFAKDPQHRSFLIASFGAGLNFHIGAPFFSLSGSAGPGWSGTNDGILPDGVGFTGRLAMFPFYGRIVDDIECNRGWFSTYVLSGLSVWGEAREDFFSKRSGSTLAFGGGIDLGRNVLLPILHEVLSGRCGV